MHIKRALSSLAFVALFITLACCTQQHSSTATITQSHIDLAISSLNSRANKLLRETGVPGMAIAVVHGNKVIFAKGFGVRKVGTNSPVDADTVFQLASMSKSLASTVAAAVVSEGQVKWDDPIAKYIPGFTLNNAEVGAKVTIADMFAHRSGLPGYTGDVLEVLGCKRMEIIDRLKDEPLKPYRKQYDYSNFGLTTGAQAVANASGLSWEALSKKELYDRLAMTSTSSSWSDYNNRPNKADIHIKNAQDQWIVSIRNDDEGSPAGGVSSSVNDLAKWMMLELNNGSDSQGRQIINADVLHQTQQPQIIMSPATETKPAYYYGLGKIIGYDNTGRLRISHSGAFPQGVSTTFELLPSEKLGIVIVTNSASIGLPETIAQEFYDIVEYGSLQHDWHTELFSLFKKMNSDQGQLAGTQPPSPPIPALPDKDYVGTYVSKFYGPATIKREGNDLVLTLKPCNVETTSKLTHWSGNTFGFPYGNLTAAPTSALEFAPASDGQAAKIRIEYLDMSGLGSFTKIP